MHLPLLNEAFGTSPLSPGDWALWLAAASVVLWVEEARKLLARRR